jgi:hypothetical protein
MKGDEISTYPLDRHIIFKTTRQTWDYNIIEEGVYPPIHKLVYTKKPESFPIPNKYIVKTMHGKKKDQAECSIDYIDGRPLYNIQFGENMKYNVCSTSSPTGAATKYIKVNINKM